MDNKPIIEKPGKRIYGVDSYVAQRTAENILKEMERLGWSVGEAKLLSRYLMNKVKENQKRQEDAKPLLVVGVNQQ